MLVLGIYCEDIRNDSSFWYVSGEFCSVSLQSADHIADTHIYSEKSSFNLIEELILLRQSIRTFVGFRIYQCMLSALLMIIAYLSSFFFRNSDLCMNGSNNQYARRTLEYIHHNDGKKSPIL